MSSAQVTSIFLSILNTYQQGKIAEEMVFSLQVNLEIGTITIKATNTVSARTLELKPSQIMLFYRYLTEAREELLIQPTKSFLIGKRGNSIDFDTFKSIFRPL